jgi:autotransporter-associated beta strand protein
MKSKNNPLQHLGIIALAFAGVSSPLAHAATDTWQGTAGSTDWATDANWTYSTGSAITSGDSLVFTSANASPSTTLTNTLATSFSAAAITFNSGALSYTMTGNAFNLTGGITNNSVNLQTINNAITLSNAAHTFNAASGGITLGGAFSGTTIQTVTFVGPGTTTLSGTNTFNTKNANFNAFVVGGTVTAGASTGGNVSITGATTVDGGTTTDSRGFIDIHGNSTLTIQSGGSFTINGTTNNAAISSIGQNAIGTSTLKVNGGSLTVSGAQGFVLGNNRSDATGVLQISSGTATITAGSTTRTDARSSIALGRDNANGRIDLDGGTLETGRYFVRDSSGGGTAGSGTANFNFNGGTLKALANQTAGTGWFETATTGNFQVVTTTVKAGGAKIDTNGFNTNINTVLAHDSGLGGTADGGLTKSGTGTLTLGGVNTYTGATTISGGTLALGAAGSIDNTSGVSLGTGGTFDVSAKSGYTVNNLSGSGTVTGALTVSTQLAIGNSPGTVNFSGDLILGSGATYTYEMVGGGTAADLGDVAGNLTLTSSLLDLVQLGTFTNGDKFTLFAYDGALTGTFNGLADDTTFTDAGGEWLINYNDTAAGFNGGTGNSFVTVTAVPEPTAALLGALGMLGLLRRRRAH